MVRESNRRSDDFVIVSPTWSDVHVDMHTRVLISSLSG